MAIQIPAVMASEKLKYTTYYQDENIEIRYYDEAVFAKVASKGNMFDGRNQHFSTLAGYIFGKNEASEKIGMTSPVLMHNEDDKSVMQFVMPSRYDMNTLPEPNDPSVELKKSEGFWAVTIRYGGYNNNSKFKKHKEKLDDFIQQNELPSSGELYFLGYDPPFRVAGRTNEILVKLNGKPETFLQAAKK